MAQIREHPGIQFIYIINYGTASADVNRA